jgi:hypothetical protein
LTPDQHVTISVGSGVILGLLLRSWVAGISCCLIGIFIDIDHIFELWLNRGFSLDPRKLFDFCYNGTSKKFYDILHGYEYIPLYLWTCTIPGCRNLGWGLTTGYTLHLIADQLYNTHLNRWTYFLTYRAYHGFRFEKMVLYNPFQDKRAP